MAQSLDQTWTVASTLDVHADEFGAMVVSEVVEVVGRLQDDAISERDQFAADNTMRRSGEREVHTVSAALRDEADVALHVGGLVAVEADPQFGDVQAHAVGADQG